MSRKLEEKIEKITAAFGLPTPVTEIRVLSGGHINQTWRITCQGSPRRYVIQQINTEIFREADALMENCRKVTDFLRERIRCEGGDSEREVLEFLPTVDGKMLYRDAENTCWRVMYLVEGAASHDSVNEALLQESGRAFGRFQRMLAEFPAAELVETIPDFHHTPKRYERFLQAVRQDVCDRACEVQAEIAFVLERGERLGKLQQLKDSGELPLRVTHNDAKLANVLLDEKTGEAVCVIDLDTVMPGLSVLDYGDSIRYGACTAAEDEPDSRKVKLDLSMVKAYTKGFLSQCGSSLTTKEIEMLPEGVWTITMEQGIRFLTDYLEGDHYYQTSRLGQNLDRARTQFALAADMERKWEDMNRIIQNFR